MLVVTTPTGNTGRYVLQSLLAQGEAVRVLVRDPTRLDASIRERCEVVQGDLRNPVALKPLLEGAEGVFFCVPQSPSPDDIRAYYRAFAEPFAAAAKASGVARVVAISSGDGKGSGFQGIGQALHDVEQTIAATGLAARYVRCGYFMENFFWMIQPIVRAGRFSLPVAEAVPIPFVAACDIGHAAARLLLDRTWSDQTSMAAHGPTSLSCAAAARIASESLGFPIRFQSVSGADYKDSLAVHGVSDALAQSLVEMFAAITRGQDMAAPAERKAECPTTLQTWMETQFKAAVAQVKTHAPSQ